MCPLWCVCARACVWNAKSLLPVDAEFLWQWSLGLQQTSFALLGLQLTMVCVWIIIIVDTPDTGMLH